MVLKNRRRNKAKLADRKKRATARELLSNGRTPEDQLKELDKRLGVGVGAKRERARLALLVGKPKKLKKI